MKTSRIVLHLRVGERENVAVRQTHPGVAEIRTIVARATAISAGHIEPRVETLATASLCQMVLLDDVVSVKTEMGIGAAVLTTSVATGWMGTFAHGSCKYASRDRRVHSLRFLKCRTTITLVSTGTTTVTTTDETTITEPGDTEWTTVTSTSISKTSPKSPQMQA